MSFLCLLYILYLAKQRAPYVGHSQDDLSGLLYALKSGSLLTVSYWYKTSLSAL